MRNDSPKKQTATEVWDRHHPIAENGTPMALYTDEHPATTIKGLGFKDEDMAKRTIELTSQPGVRYKQFWTIKAMRERAAHHKFKTPGITKAMEIFDEWLENYQQPSAKERKEQEQEWRAFRALCQSAANQHSYGKHPTHEDLTRARNDIKKGRECLLEGLKMAQQARLSSAVRTSFPITAFTALFGGPGNHGYGSHKMQRESESIILINGTDGVKELSPAAEKALVSSASIECIRIVYDRSKQQLASVDFQYSKNRATLEELWSRVEPLSAPHDGSGKAVLEKRPSPISWTCSCCTLEHIGASKQMYLACEVCGATRTDMESSHKKQKANSVESLNGEASASSRTSTHSAQTKSSNSWGSLRPPSEKDVRGPRKRQKALDAPPPLLDYLVVLDFEWTADDKRQMKPVAEITQFPSVLLKIVEKTKGVPLEVPKQNTNVPLPSSLTLPSSNGYLRQDALAVSAFDTFVRPTLNPVLTEFSIGLTAITQEQVNSAPEIKQALCEYVQWLKSLDLVDENGFRKGNWFFATWGDVDVMHTLRLELEYKSLKVPPCFDRWINLKSDSVFKKHYNREPRGGLRACVESTGATWEGRAHNGLVDSFNTAKIVRHMVQTGFRFTRPTRGFGKDMVPFGLKKK